jgi:serine/threonine-protein kinase
VTFNVLEESGSASGPVSTNTAVLGDTERASRGQPGSGGSSLAVTTIYGRPHADDELPGSAHAEVARLRAQLAEAKKCIKALELELSNAGLARPGEKPGESAPGGSAEPQPNVPPATVEEYLTLLEKSRLLSPEQFEQARAVGRDAKNFAKRLVNARLLTEWQAAQLVAGRSSFFLGQYKLIRLIGRGKSGAVFLAEHVTLRRCVAIRTISTTLTQKSATIERFMKEARLIATLDHANIVRAYSFDRIGTRFYLVMEYVDGQSLEQVVRRRGPLPYDVAARYIGQAAEGLQHTHGTGIIQCDIKPSSLLVNAKGVVKLVDIGLSRLQELDATGSGVMDDERMLDSIDYLAPEEILGKPDLDHSADIYSLGCTLYFLLTGRPPFPEGLLYERVMKHQSEEPEPIGNLRNDVPARLIQICNKMMAKRPEDRIQSAMLVSKAIRTFLTEEAFL